MRKGLQLPTGRVIALGRLMLATLFLVAVRVDISQPAPLHGLLAAYAVFALAVVVATWNNWWLDARLAGPTHAVDILLFTLLVVLTEGYTSPFFTFFIFVLLSAAIRWGWHVTALTAILLTLLFLIAGLVIIEPGTPLQLQRFVIRTGHLVILSLILIWFGANQWRARFDLRDEEPIARPSLDQSPLETSLRAAMDGARASTGIFVWRQHGRHELVGLAIRGGKAEVVDAKTMAIGQALAPTPFLYDIATNRALRKDAQRNPIHFASRDVIEADDAAKLQLGEGLAIPIRSDGGEGEMFLEHVRSLSTDHIDLGEQIAADVAAHLQRHALLRAAEESAEGRLRLTLARDLHDSVVQFLAGAAFRLEAIKRSDASGRDIEPELVELKQLMLQEQGDLRSFITALRSGPLVSLNDLAKDLAALADRLSRQWDVDCVFSARPADMMVPIRLHLDLHQMMKEAVANAVRHAEAKSITVELEAVADELRLEFVNDGTAIPKRGRWHDVPMSLKERVEEAGGALDMARGMGVTKVSISLPVGVSRW